jgi:hypothetical protein
VRDEGLRGPRTGAEIDEIAVITPLKAMTNPRIPIGVTCEIKPANRVIRPKSRSPPLRGFVMVRRVPLMKALKLGVDLQLKEQPPSLPRGAFHDLIKA